MYSDLAKDQTAINLNIGHDNSYNGVPIKFNHALSSIHFALHNATDQTAKREVYLVSIAISSVKNTGTFVEKVTNNGWDTSESEIKDYVTYNMTDNPVKFTRSPKHVKEIILENDEDYENEKCYSLLLIPQVLDNIDVEVKYVVVSEEEDLADVLEDSERIETSTIGIKGKTGEQLIEGGTDEYVNSPVNSWEPGKRYTYVIRYGAGSTAKDYIYFAPESHPWKDVDNIMLEIQ